MAKLSKEEFNNKYSEMIKDNDDLLIALMEDFDDSIIDDSEEITKLKSDIESKDAEIDALKKKYIERFKNGVEEVVKEVTEELEEKELVDVKEI